MNDIEGISLAPRPLPPQLVLASFLIDNSERLEKIFQEEEIIQERNITQITQGAYALALAAVYDTHPTRNSQTAIYTLSAFLPHAVFVLNGSIITTHQRIIQAPAQIEGITQESTVPNRAIQGSNAKGYTFLENPETINQLLSS